MLESRRIMDIEGEVLAEGPEVDQDLLDGPEAHLHILQ